MFVYVCVSWFRANKNKKTGEDGGDDVFDDEEFAQADDDDDMFGATPSVGVTVAP